MSELQARAVIALLYLILIAQLIDMSDVAGWTYSGITLAGLFLAGTYVVRNYNKHSRGGGE